MKELFIQQNAWVEPVGQGGNVMASTKEYLDFVLEQLAGLESIKVRPMMGEYILYSEGKVVGGVYDDRLLLKSTTSALRLMQEAGLHLPMDLPYEGAKEMLLADVDRQELLCRMVQGIADDLPAPGKKKRSHPGKTGKDVLIQPRRKG